MRVPNGWDRFRECPACGFSFCDVCSRTWHGPHSACPLSSIPAFIKQYYDLAENDPVRRQLEARYGKRNLEQLAAKAREDDENRKWLEANSRNCPGCQVVVEKSVGCNHVSPLRIAALALQHRLLTLPFVGPADDLRAMPGALLLLVRVVRQFPSSLVALLPLPLQNSP